MGGEDGAGEGGIGGGIGGIVREIVDGLEGREGFVHARGGTGFG